MKMPNIALLATLFVLTTAQAVASNVTFMRNSPLSQMTPEDLALFRATVREVLEKGTDGTARRWDNPNTGASGVVTPLKSYERDGRPCRNVEIFNEAKGFSGRTRYDFCKQPDGTWRSATSGK